jgi:hypothetical protein
MSCLSRRPQGPLALLQRTATGHAPVESEVVCPPRGQRSTSRALHLSGTVALLVFVYGPAGLTAALQPWMQLVVVPLLSLTGCSCGTRHKSVD